MSTTSMVLNFVLAFMMLPKDIDSDIDPTSLILLPLKAYKGFVASLRCLLSYPIWLKVDKNKISG
jgi:hypothetical protein